MVYAVIDTNVWVSYFISKDYTPPVAVVREMLGGRIVPLFNDYLMDEYRNVLSRKKFNLRGPVIDSMLNTIQSFGLKIEDTGSGIELPDMKDVPIFRIAFSTRDLDSYLVTGNTRHFPKIDFVVTPKQMMELLDNATR